MKTLGILLVSYHYPRVTPDADRLDSQLRRWLEAFGAEFETIQVFVAYDGHLPRHAAACDAWLLSGAPLPPANASDDHAFAMRQFLRAAHALGRTIFAINHSEHVLHDALAGVGVPRPNTSQHPRAVRNPFRSFHLRDTLHRFNPSSRTVEPLDRPTESCTRWNLSPLVEGVAA